MTFIFINFHIFLMAYLHTSASHPTIRMSSAVPNTFGSSLNILLILCWNMSPAGSTPNSGLVNLDLQMWLNMRISYLIPGHGNLTLHQLWS